MPSKKKNRHHKMPPENHIPEARGGPSHWRLPQPRCGVSVPAVTEHLLGQLGFCVDSTPQQHTLLLASYQEHRVRRDLSPLTFPQQTAHYRCAVFSGAWIFQNCKYNQIAVKDWGSALPTTGKVFPIKSKFRLPTCDGFKRSSLH